MQEMKTIRERIEEIGITVDLITEVTGREEPPDWALPGDRQFRVRLHNPDTDQYLTVPWSIGPNADAPSGPDEVLDALASESLDWENAADYEAYAAEFDMDPDSRKGEASYRAIGDMAEELRRFLGREQYELFLWHTERL